MIKYLFIIVLLILAKPLYAQITPKTISKTIGYSVKAPKKYDNKTGFVGEKDPIDFLQYIGQDLYLPKIENMSVELDRNENWKNKKQNIQLYKINNLYSSKKDFAKISSEWDERDTSYIKNIYKPFSYRFSKYPYRNNVAFSDYDSISNKYYTIIDVQLECTRNSDGNVMYVNSLSFILLDKLSKDTLFFPSSSVRDNNDFEISMNPFVLVAYFTALQNKYDNKDIIFVSKDFYNGESGNKSLSDINTSMGFSLVHKSIVKGKVELIKLKDVFSDVESEYYGIFLLLKTQSGNAFCLYVNDDGSFSYTNTAFSMIQSWSKTNDDANKNGFFLHKEYLNNQKLNEKQLLEEKKRIKNEEQRKLQLKLTELKTKYEERIADLIITQKVEIGMTKEMCLAAWGEPIDKSKTIRQDADVETWTYSFKSRLIFKNGLLLEINQ